MNSINSINPSNPLNKVLMLCRAAVLPLDYLTAKLQNRSTARHGEAAKLQHFHTPYALRLAV
jgi:hypothetical protein